jgi:integrase
MFPKENNVKKHLCSKTAYNMLQRNLSKLGFKENVPFHALRATCIKLCQKAGWTPEQTSKHVGDTIRVIQEHYSTPSIEEMKSVTRSKPILQ